MDEQNIIFEEVPAGKGNDSTKNGDIPYAVPKGPAITIKQPIPGIYGSLYLELKEKCDPARFMTPYDPDKVAIANELYSQILTFKTDEAALKNLRKRAIKELGIRLSTEKLYKELLCKCNPKLFVGNNYDKELLDIANRVYKLVLENADDFFALEEAKETAKKIYDREQDIPKTGNPFFNFFIVGIGAECYHFALFILLCYITFLIVYSLIMSCSGY